MAPEGAEFSGPSPRRHVESARDPDRIQGLINELSSPSPVRRAGRSIRSAAWSTSVVTPLLQALADASRTDEHPAIRSAIAQMGEHLIDPMLGALETNDTPLRIQVIRTLGQFRHSRVLGGMVGPFADPDSSDEIRSAAAQAIIDMVGSLPARVHVEKFFTIEPELTSRGCCRGEWTTRIG
jgi:HEAT repeat protein